MKVNIPGILNYELSKEVLKVEFDCSGYLTDIQLYIGLHTMFVNAYSYLVAPPGKMEIRLLNTELGIKPEAVCSYLVNSIHGQFGSEFQVIQSTVDHRQGAAIHLDIHVKKGKRSLCNRRKYAAKGLLDLM